MCLNVQPFNHALSNFSMIGQCSVYLSNGWIVHFKLSDGWTVFVKLSRDWTTSLSFIIIIKIFTLCFSTFIKIYNKSISYFFTNLKQVCRCFSSAALGKLLYCDTCNVSFHDIAKITIVIFYWTGPQYYIMNLNILLSLCIFKVLPFSISILLVFYTKQFQGCVWLMTLWSEQ